MKSIAFPQVGAEPAGTSPQLTKFAWLSIATAVTTIALKSEAYLVTGSVGLLSDAAESLVNLVAAVVALIALTVASRPAGLAISTAASALNGAVGVYLIRTGRRHRSVTLTADGEHLMTDVWTSVGVILGVLLVALTGWQRLDPIVAMLVAVNILWTGYRLVSQSVTSLLDAALPEQDMTRLNEVLDRLRTADVDFAELRTRESGRHRFVSLTVLLPGAWTIDRGHRLADQVQQAIGEALPDTAVQTHIEPHRLP